MSQPKPPQQPPDPAARTPNDALTGAFTRVAFDQYVVAELAHAQQISQPLALMLLDLDHFKSVNDAFGHQRGDLVLQEFVRRARAAIRPHDLIFRYGGDEFVLLVPGAARARADQIAQRIVDDIAGRPFGVDPPLTLTVSVGVAIFPDDGYDPATLFARLARC